MLIVSIVPKFLTIFIYIYIYIYIYINVYICPDIVYKRIKRELSAEV